MMMIVIHGTSHLIRLSKRDLNVVRGRREKLSSRWHLERRIAEEQFSRGVAVGERSDGARGGIASSHVAPSTRSTLITLLGLPPPGATSALSLSLQDVVVREGRGETPRTGREIPPCQASRTIGLVHFHPPREWKPPCDFPAARESFTLFLLRKIGPQKSHSGRKDYSKFYGETVSCEIDSHGS